MLFRVSVAALCVMTGAGVLASMTPGAARAQPPADPPQRPEARETQTPRDPVFNPERLRNRLRVLLEEGERRQERLRSALKELDEGKVPEDWRQLVRGPGGLGPGAGRPGDDGPRPGLGPEGRPDGPEGDRPPPPRGPGDERRALIEAVRADRPELADRLDAFQRRNPVIAERMVYRLSGGVREALGARERDPALWRLRMDEMAGAVDIIDAGRKVLDLPEGSPERAEAQRELEAAVDRQFELKSALMQHDISQLTKRLERLNAELAKRTQNRAEAVKRWAEEIAEQLARLREAVVGPPKQERGPERRPEGAAPR